MFRVKQTIISSEDALNCMTTDSFRVDIKEVCEYQRDVR